MIRTWAPDDFWKVAQPLVELDSEDPSIEPGLSSELAGRLHAQAVQANRDAVATALAYPFGQFSCAQTAEDHSPPLDHGI